MAGLRHVRMLGLFLLIGCHPVAPIRYGRDSLPPNPDLIMISGSTSSGIHGGPTWTSEWVLSRAQPCWGKVRRGTNAGGPEQTAEYEVPPETFKECLQLLQTTGFFRMRSTYPRIQFEPSSQSVRVVYGGCEHTVTAVSGAEPPSGLDTVMNFIGELEKRGLARPADKDEKNPGATPGD